MNDERARTRGLAALLRLGALAALSACTTPAPTPVAEPAEAPATPRVGPESGQTPTAQAAPTPGPVQAPAPQQPAPQQQAPAPPQQAPGGPAVAGTGPQTGPAPAGSGGEAAPASKPCIDARLALIRCPAGEEPTHAGCEGPDYIMHCAPRRKP